MKAVFLLLLCPLIVACASLSETDKDEFEDSEFPRGAGVFSGSSGEFSAKKFFSNEKERRKSGGYYILDLDGAPPMTEEQFKEFEAFRAWIKSREQGSDEYEEYKNWRAFQDYRRLQSQEAKESEQKVK